MRAGAVAALLLMLGACMGGEPPVAQPADASAGELAWRPEQGAEVAADASKGQRRLRADGALLYVPASYHAGEAMPLVVMLHGAGGSAEHAIALARPHADRLGLIVLAPSSRAASWDIISSRSYGTDVRAIDAALAEAAAEHWIDPGRIAIGGFSDGASYALSLGITNGELFSDILAFSPGFSAAARGLGRPAIFISHGIGDRVLPIDVCSRTLVPRLRASGYKVRYEEFDGGHVVPDLYAREAFDRFAA